MKAPLTELQLQVFKKVIRAWLAGTWYRAERAGERVTLASLYRNRLLDRRAWRGEEGERDAAHEYQPSGAVIEAWNSKNEAQR